MPDLQISEHRASAGGHETFYLACGPDNGLPMIFVHGWPELSLSWRHQLPCFGALGFRAIAPDMRGYGRSSVYRSHADYAQEHVVGDMLRLADSLGIGKAIWVGHDWGSPTAWNIASHHPDRCNAVASLCVPYRTLECGLDSVIPLVDRRVYPEDRFPAGQWEYQRFYEENFAKATAAFDANPYNVVKALFRKGNPAGRMKPAATAFTRQQGGWFGGAGSAPDVPRDGDVVSEADLRVYAEALQRNGFFGPDSYYANHAANAAYAAKSVNDGYLDMPALFLAARHDYVCETVDSRLGEPMRTYCRKLTSHIVDSGHWMAQERPIEVNAHLARWLARDVPGGWPG